MIFKRQIFLGLAVVLDAHSPISAQARSASNLSPLLECDAFSSFFSASQKTSRTSSLGEALISEQGEVHGIASSDDKPARLHIAGAVTGAIESLYFISEVISSNAKVLQRVQYRGADVVREAPESERRTLTKGKKVLVWAGARGPNIEKMKTLPMWRSGELTSAQPWFIEVPESTGAVSDEGTIYYYPEGVLELFLRKPPFVKKELERIFLWSGGCIKNAYPSPWPSMKIPAAKK